LFRINIHKKYFSKNRIVEIGCSVENIIGETIALYGKSGIGKSTVLRMIAGLETPDSGDIEFNNTVWFSKEKGINLPISERKIGFVFQDYNLFPTMTVEKNLKYASHNNTISPIIKALIKSLQLDDLLQNYPSELSGGQRQRIAIVRAICQEPQLLLLDEPFSALDDDSIEELMNEIKFIQKDFGTKVMIISHRKDVVLSMSDYVIIMTPEQKTLMGLPSELLVKHF